MSDTKVEATPGGYEIVITRTINAPRAKVYKAYKDPKLVVQWLGPKDLTMKIESW
jgi:uncharacterized protein YndB with AHSA1/START domain